VQYWVVYLSTGGVLGWPSGTSIDSQDTLSFSINSGVRSMNQVFPLEHASEAYELMMSGKARFRCVLTTGQARKVWPFPTLVSLSILKSCWM
jgi:D-arabinose 1-dehydrogenase-like Zn-dependent alcohol dehydrogenase